MIPATFWRRRRQPRAVVVGCGHMGSYHVRALRRLGVDVVTVDPDPAKGAMYPTLDAAPPVEYAVVAAPVEHLADEARAAMLRDMHVLAEKPFAPDVARGRELCALAAQRGLTLAVGYTERGNPAVRALRDHLYLAGEIESIWIHREGPAPQTPRAVVADLAVHDIDVLRFLGLAPRLRSIAERPMAATLGLEAAGVEITLNVDGAAARKRRTLTVHGSRAMLELDYQARTLTRLSADGAELLTGDRKVHALDEQLKAFLARRPFATGEDGLAVLEVLEVLAPELSRLERGDERSLGGSA